MKKLFSLICLVFLSKIYSQSQGIALNIGYATLNTNVGYIGGEYTYRINPENWHGISIGAGTYYGSFNGNFKFIPTANIIYSNTLFLGEFNISQYHINPNLGINIMNRMRIKAGYSWNIGDNDKINIKGFSFGINLLLGTSGFYDKFEMKY